MLNNLYVQDIITFININNIHCTEEKFADVLLNPGKELGSKVFKQFKSFKGQFREYCERLRIYLLNAINTCEQSIFLMNFNDFLLRDKFRELNDFNPLKIAFTHENQQFLNSKNILTTAVNTFFPEIYDVKIEGRKYSLIEQIYLHQKFYEIMLRIVALNVFKIMEKNPYEPVSSFFPKYFPRTNGNQIAWNFPVTVAKWVYTTVLETFRDEPVLYVGDTSLGWGGRLAGLMASLGKNGNLYQKKVVLLGTDPNTTIIQNLKKILSRHYLTIQEY